MSGEDWQEMKAEFKSIRDKLDLKVDKTDCCRTHDALNVTVTNTQQNSTDLVWMKRIFWGAISALSIILTGVVVYLITGKL
jgi:hypothetical protein